MAMPKVRGVYTLVVGHKKDMWFIHDWEGKTIAVEYSIENAKELLAYFKENR